MRTLDYRSADTNGTRRGRWAFVYPIIFFAVGLLIIWIMGLLYSMSARP